MFFMNLLTIFIVIDIVIGGLDHYLERFNDKLAPLFLGGVIFFVNYLFIYTDGRYVTVIKNYSKRSLEERKKGARITLFYGLGSIILVFILAPLRVL